MRSTARLPDPLLGASAADCAVVISPASALSARRWATRPAAHTRPRRVPASQCLVDDAITVLLGTLLDQPRHLVLELKPDAPPVTVSPNLNPNLNPNPNPNLTLTLTRTRTRTPTLGLTLTLTLTPALTLSLT